MPNAARTRLAADFLMGNRPGPRRSVSSRSRDPKCRVDQSGAELARVRGRVGRAHGLVRLRDGDQGQLARRAPLERRAILPVGVHKAQKLLQRDDLGHISAREALMWKARRPEGGFAAFCTVSKAVA